MKYNDKRRKIQSVEQTLLLFLSFVTKLRLLAASTSRKRKQEKKENFFSSYLAFGNV